MTRSAARSRSATNVSDDRALDRIVRRQVERPRAGALEEPTGRIGRDLDDPRLVVDRRRGERRPASAVPDDGDEARNARQPLRPPHLHVGRVPGDRTVVDDGDPQTPPLHVERDFLVRDGDRRLQVVGKGEADCHTANRSVASRHSRTGENHCYHQDTNPLMPHSFRLFLRRPGARGGERAVPQLWPSLPLGGKGCAVRYPRGIPRKRRGRDLDRALDDARLRVC